MQLGGFGDRIRDADPLPGSAPRTGRHEREIERLDQRDESGIEISVGGDSDDDAIHVGHGPGGRFHHRRVRRRVETDQQQRPADGTAGVEQLLA